MNTGKESTELLQTACKNCGKCCENGGPALHTEDRVSVLEKTLAESSLVTLRKGELVDNPQENSVSALPDEIIKIKGQGKKWSCFYYDNQQKICTIYQFRPLACRTLKCWDTKEILALMGKNLLSRKDLISADNPILAVIDHYEERFILPDLHALYTGNGEYPEGKKEELAALIEEDLQFRAKIIHQFALNIDQELFYFGRPIFQLIQGLGIKVSCTPYGKAQIFWPK